MTDPLYEYEHVDVVEGTRSQLVRIGLVPVTVAELYFAVAHMARIQRETFDDDDDSSLSILGDLAEIRSDETPDEIDRESRQIAKKWKAVRLVLRQRRRRSA